MPLAKADRKSINTLLDIMAALRDPKSGCPWDIKQDFKSITPYTIEEAFEVAEAIELGDMEALCDELGDLLLQVIFHSQMAKELGHFSFEHVIEAISTKMIRRHPHVFGEPHERGIEPEKGFWENIKDTEKAHKTKGLLDDVPVALPALKRAQKLQKKAARVGFDWPDTAGVMDKISEELAEVTQAIKSDNRQHMAEEIGDLLFSVVNLARHLDIDAEHSLRSANHKFCNRFKHMEETVNQSGKQMQQLDLDELEQLWQQAKKDT